MEQRGREVVGARSSVAGPPAFPALSDASSRSAAKRESKVAADEGRLARVWSVSAPAAMSTTPSRLARLAISSGSWPDARARARSLYRSWYRSAPEFCELYAISITPAMIRAKVRQVAEQQRNVQDLDAYDILLHKAHQEYQETANIWKQEVHIYNMFMRDQLPAKPVTFMDKFLEGRDEGAVQPTAS